MHGIEKLKTPGFDKYSHRTDDAFIFFLFYLINLCVYTILKCCIVILRLKNWVLSLYPQILSANRAAVEIRSLSLVSGNWYEWVQLTTVQYEKC